MTMKTKPVRVCDVSRILRISSASLISFLQENGYSVKGDFRSPLSSKMVELIQTGYQEGPPFQELNTLLPQAEQWEKHHSDIVRELHTPPAKPKRKASVVDDENTPRRRRQRKTRKREYNTPHHSLFAKPLNLSALDMELIQRILELDEERKIIVRDYFRRKILLKAIRNLE